MSLTAWAIAAKPPTAWLRRPKLFDLPLPRVSTDSSPEDVWEASWSSPSSVAVADAAEEVLEALVLLLLLLLVLELLARVVVLVLLEEEVLVRVEYDDDVVGVYVLEVVVLVRLVVGLGVEVVVGGVYVEVGVVWVLVRLLLVALASPEPKTQDIWKTPSSGVANWLKTAGEKSREP